MEQLRHFDTIHGRQVFLAVIEHVFGPLGAAGEQPLAGIHEAYALAERNRTIAKRLQGKQNFPFAALRAQDRIENYSLLDLTTGPGRGSVFGNPADVSRPLVVLTDQTTFHFNAGRTEGRAEPAVKAAA